MSGRQIAIDKKPGVCPVGVGETWRHVFAKCVLKIAGPEAINACQYDQVCANLEAEIDGYIYGVQAIWDAKFSTENWVFLLVGAKNAFKKINRIGMLWTNLHLWPSKNCLLKLISQLVIARLAERKWGGHFTSH